MKYADNLFFAVVFMLFSLSFLSAGGNLFSDEYPSWLTWKPDPRAVKSGLYVVPKPFAGKATVSFKVIEPSGAARMNWPVRGSIPLFRGELKDPSLIRLKDSSGKQIPVQGRATAFWPEKTVRFLCIDFVTDIKAGEEKSFTLEYGTDVGSASKSSSTSELNTYSFKNRTLTFEFKKGKDFLTITQSKPVSRKIPVIGKAVICSSEKGENPKGLPLVIDSISLAEKGTVQETVHLLGHYGEEKGHAPSNDKSAYKYPVSIFMRMYAHTPYIFTEFTFGYNGDEYADFVQSYGLTLKTGMGKGKFRFGSDEKTEMDSPLGVRLNQFSHNQFTLTGAKKHQGKRFGGWGAVQEGQSRVFVAMREAWQNWPAAIQAEKNGDLTFEMMGEKPDRGLDLRYEPKGHTKDRSGPRVKSHSMLTGLGDRLSGNYANSNHRCHGRARGIRKIHELLIQIGPVLQTGSETAQAFSKPLVPWPGGKRFADTKVLGHIGVYGDPKYDQMRDYFSVMLDIFPVVHEEHGLYGWVDWGDFPMIGRGLKEGKFQFMLYGGHGWANGERTLVGYFYHYAGEGGRRFLDLGRTMVHHTIGIDTEHRGGDQRLGDYHRHDQVHWRENGFARQGGYRGWHVYYWMTGDLEVGRLAMDVGVDAAESRLYMDLTGKQAKFKYGSSQSSIHLLAHLCWITTGDWKYARATHAVCRMGEICATQGKKPSSRTFITVDEEGEPVYKLETEGPLSGYWYTYGDDDVLLEWASLTGDPAAVNGLLAVGKAHKPGSLYHPPEALYVGLAALDPKPEIHAWLDRRISHQGIRRLRKKGRKITGVYKSAADWSSFNVFVHKKNGFSIQGPQSQEFLHLIYARELLNKKIGKPNNGN